MDWLFLFIIVFEIILLIGLTVALLRLNKLVARVQSHYFSWLRQLSAAVKELETLSNTIENVTDPVVTLRLLEPALLKVAGLRFGSLLLRLASKKAKA